MKIGAIIVSYNRLNLLKKLINRYDTTIGVDELVVVDNCSTDGTREYLATHQFNIQPVKIIQMPSNKGGSGGFHAGLKYMLNRSLDWIYLSDDDAFFKTDTFSSFREKIKEYDTSNISAVCTSVINTGKIDPDHRRRVEGKIRFREVICPLELYAQKDFELDLFSYVGVFINKLKLRSDNLPEKDFFVRYDDTEHALQLSKEGRLICIPSLKVHHDIAANQSRSLDWKEYYGRRNQLLTIRKHFGVSAFLYAFISTYTQAIEYLMRFNFKNFKIFHHASMDALKGKKGLHSIYKPGW